MAGKTATEVRSAWAAVWVILIGLAMAGGGAYLVYKYRLRVRITTCLFFFSLEQRFSILPTSVFKAIEILALLLYFIPILDFGTYVFWF